MNLKLEEEFSKAPILAEVDALKKQIDDVRPLSPEIEGRVMQKLRLDWNYNSNAIEGNKLSYGETTALLMHGITAKGKPLKDHLDLKGHNEAIGYLDRIIKDGRPLTEADIRGLHEVILVESYEVKAQTSEGLPTTKAIQIGKYKSSDNHVETITGEIHYYTPYQEIPAKMEELMDWYYSMIKDSSIHPVITAALLHYKFVAIHPFDDGNGRMARILMNLVLMQNGFPPVVVKNDDKQNYYALLSQAHVGEFFPFVEYITERLNNSLKIYVKAINGGSIEEDEDIDKEIALFKINLLNEINVKERRSITLINNILILDIQPLLNEIEKKLEQFSDLFFEWESLIAVIVDQDSKWEYESVDHFINSTTTKHRDSVIDKLQILGFIINFKRFKNDQNDFDVESWVTINFEEYYYEISKFNGDSILRKLYHERLNANDKMEVVKSCINELKAIINKKIKKSPK